MGLVHIRFAMRWTTYVIFVVSVVAGSVTENRNEKAFSLFSVVTFPNKQCQTNMADMLGICVTEEECAARTGGSAQGNCASGFGVCCLTVIEDPANAITNNLTYIQNPGFPTGVGSAAPVTALNRAYNIRGGASIQQVRLDFITTVVTGPTAATADNADSCVDDTITVTSPSTTSLGFVTLCGVLSGQHMYIENDGAEVNAVLNINTDGDALNGGRSWKILVSLLETGCPSLATPGCLQYFTGASGSVQSFNYEVNGAQGQMLRNLQYNACIRSEAGMDCIRWTEARSATAPDAFQLQGDGAADATASLLEADCPEVFVNIRGNNAIGTANGIGDRFCGGVFNSVDGATVSGPVISNRKPFMLGVYSSGLARPAQGGFDLVYNQEPCGP